MYNLTLEGLALNHKKKLICQENPKFLQALQDRPIEYKALRTWLMRLEMRFTWLTS